MERKQQSPEKPKQKYPDWGQVLGTFCNVPAYCNNHWRDKIQNWQNIRQEIKLFYSYIDPKITGLREARFTGIKYQCVEYARRFMIVNQDCQFQDVDVAWMIYDLKEVEDIFDSNKKIPFLSFPNNSKELPKAGDLLIFQKSQNQPVGHVAVVTQSNLVEKYVDIIEQNYNHKWFAGPNYARRLKVEMRNDNYYINNIIVDKDTSEKCEEDSESDEDGIIGWKRVERPLKYFK